MPYPQVENHLDWWIAGLDGWMDGWMDRWMDGWIDGLLFLLSLARLMVEAWRRQLIDKGLTKRKKALKRHLLQTKKPTKTLLAY